MPSQNRGCLAALFGLFSGPSVAPPSPPLPTLPQALPYRLRDDFLSPIEFSFYSVLSSIVRARALICPKVRIADILFVAQQRDYFSYLNRISAKHVDFILCDLVTLKPLFAVELDDSSHSRANREARDEFVDDAFRAAGLPLLRFPAQREYNVQEVAVRVEPLLQPAPAAPEAPQSDPIPLCPKCGVAMVLRVATRGRRQGMRFYGCPNYPRCRQMKPLSAPDPSTGR